MSIKLILSSMTVNGKFNIISFVKKAYLWDRMSAFLYNFKSTKQRNLSIGPMSWLWRRLAKNFDLMSGLGCTTAFSNVFLVEMGIS